jgi:hypothetical protein
MTTTREERKATNLELWRLYNIQRSAYLNVLYYGKRAATCCTAEMCKRMS